MKKDHTEKKRKTNPGLAPGMKEEPLLTDAKPKEIRRGEYTRVVRLEEKYTRD